MELADLEAISVGKRDDAGGPSVLEIFELTKQGRELRTHGVCFDRLTAYNRGAVADRALVAVCSGCCCGHPESGGPKTPPRVLKPAVRRRMRHANLDGQARVAMTDCLGPCSEANVVFVYIDGRPLWLRRMNHESLYDLFFAWLREALGDGVRPPLPRELAERSFTWTGGGDGPAPPIP